MPATENYYGPCHGISPLLETAKMFLGQDMIQNVLYNLQKDFGPPEDSDKKAEMTSMKDVMDGVVNMLGGEDFVQDVLLNMSGAFKEAKADGQESEQPSGSTEPRPEFICPMASEFLKQFATMDNHARQEQQRPDKESKQSSDSTGAESTQPSTSGSTQELGASSKSSTNQKQETEEETSQGSSKTSQESARLPSGSINIPSISYFLKAFLDAGLESETPSKPKAEQKDESSEPSVRPKGSVKEEVEKPVDNEFKIEFKAKGFEPEDIKITVKDGFVFVRAEREETDEEGITRSQKFDKKLELPSHVNPDEVTCRFKEGVITILAPLNTKPKETVLKVSVSTNAEGSIAPLTTEGETGPSF